MNLRHRLCALLMLAWWLPYYAHCMEPHGCGVHGSVECNEVFDVHPHGCADDESSECPVSECHPHDPATPGLMLVKIYRPASVEGIIPLIIPAPSFAGVPKPLPPAPASRARPPLPTILVNTALPVRGPAV